MAEGRKDFVAGQVLSESDLDDYLMGQEVMRFADASARNTALSGILTEGQCAYLKDVDQLTMYNGSAWVIMGYVGSATGWTPTPVQTGTVPVTVDYATVHRQGKQVSGRFRLTCTGAGGSAGVLVSVSTPFDAFVGASINDVVGTGFIYDSSAGAKYRALLVMGAQTNFRFLTLHSTTDGYLGATDFIFACAANDIITGQFQYEAASASA